MEILSRAKIIGLEIPEIYYRKLAILRSCADNNRNRHGHPITNDNVYHLFRTLMDQLANWLLDHTQDFGYRTAAFDVIGWEGHKVMLYETDNPFGAYWTNNVIDHISDQYQFGGLLDQWANDP